MSKAIKSLSLTFQGVDDVQSSDRLSASMLGVGDGVTDNVLKEGLEDASGLVIDGARDSLDTSSSGESADSRLGDTEDGSSVVLAGLLLNSLAAVLTGNFTKFAGLSSVDRTHLFLLFYFLICCCVASCV